jgi:hypothetical protein
MKEAEQVRRERHGQLDCGEEACLEEATEYPS